MGHGEVAGPSVLVRSWRVWGMMRRMSTVTRVSLVAAALFAAVAVAVVLVPVSSDGAECGSLVAPDWTEDQVDDIVDGAREIAGDDFSGQFGGEAVGLATNARASGRACDQLRSTRWVIVGVAGGLAVVAPAVVLFVGGGRRKRTA